MRYVVTGNSAVAAWAKTNGIDVIDAEADYVAALTQRLSGQRLDWIFSVANLRPLSTEFLQLSTNGGVNYHDGPLPRYGGVHAPAWAIIAREPVHGITWHVMSEQLDAGDIILQQPIRVDADETSLTLNLKCFQAGAESFDRVLQRLASGDVRTQQHALDRTTYHRVRDRVPAAATLDWSQSADELAAIVRALDFGNYRNTLGVAKAAFPEALFVVRKARALRGHASMSPGSVARIDSAGIVISTGKGDLVLESFATLEGEPVALTEVAARAGVAVGLPLPAITSDLRARLSDIDRQSAAFEHFWVSRLLHASLLALPARWSATVESGASGGGVWRWLPARQVPRATLVDQQPQMVALASVCAWLGQVGGRASYDLSLVSPATEGRLTGLERWVMETVPLAVDLNGGDIARLAETLAAEIRRLRRAGTPLRDLVARAPDLQKLPSGPVIGVTLVKSFDGFELKPRCALLAAINENGEMRLGYDSSVVNGEDVSRDYQEWSGRE